MKARRGRSSVRGVTMVEFMVGSAIALVLTAAAMSFTAYEARLVGMSKDQLDVLEAGRDTLDLIAADLRRAGQGIGYDVNGRFMGFISGQNSVGSLGLNYGCGCFLDGAIVYGSCCHYLSKQQVDPTNPTPGTYFSTGHEFAVIYANGDYATLADFSTTGNNGQYCFSQADGTTFNANDLVLLRSEDGLSAMAARITPGTVGAPCTWGTCADGCVDFTFTPEQTDPFDIQTSPAALNANYLGGEVLGGLTIAAWFFDMATDTLHRAEFREPQDLNGCATDDCGGDVLENVDALLVVPYTFDPTNNAWVLNNGFLNTEDRIRFDIELAVRGNRISPKKQASVQLRLTGECLPDQNNCDVTDYVSRRVYRTSVQVVASGNVRMN